MSKGHVIVKCNRTPELASRLRIIFKGVETMLAYDVAPGMFRTHTYDLFKTATTLWKKENTDAPMELNKTYRFQFTVQLPMVQYPPSLQHHLYKCYYILLAYLEPVSSSTEFPAVAHQQIKYIPLIETRPLKTPLYLDSIKCSNKKTLVDTMQIKLDAREYVSGDTIKISVRATHDDGSHTLIVNVRLYRILTFLDNPMYPMEETVKQTTVVLQDWRKEDIWFRTSSDLTPSVDYSPIVRLTYRLKVKVSVRKEKPAVKSRRLSFTSWPNQYTTTTATFETPLVIGTLGSGMRVLDELSTYSFHPNRQAYPKFVKDANHHEDALPQYEPSRLPCYSFEQQCESV